MFSNHNTSAADSWNLNLQLYFSRKVEAIFFIQLVRSNLLYSHACSPFGNDGVRSFLRQSLFYKSLAITHRWHSICQCSTRTHLLMSGCRCCTAREQGLPSLLKVEMGSYHSSLSSHLYNICTRTSLLFYPGVSYSLSPGSFSEGRPLWWAMKILTSQSAHWLWFLIALRFCSTCIL